MTLNEKITPMRYADDLANLSPVNEVVKVINLLADYYEDGDLGSREDLVSLFKNMRQSPDDCTIFFRGELAEKERALLEGAPGVQAVEIQFALFDLGLAYCVEAMRPGLGLDHQWNRVCWAHNCLGRLHGSILGHAIGEIAAIAGRAKHGAAVRHKENRGMKQDVFKWLTENMDRFSSWDGAAEAIAGDVVPVKFRTARDWIDQWRKLQSNGAL